MSAKEMFEKLGYKKTIDTKTTKDTLILYDKWIDRVEFNVESKYFSNTVYNMQEKDKNYLDKLNNAINKQIEELGWKVDE